MNEMKKLIAALIGASFVLGAAPAFAGEWRLDARRCQDIREDWRDARENRRDERYDYGRRDRVEDRYDRREDRRDRSITVCPRSAIFYVADRGDRRSYDRGHNSRNRYEQPRLQLRYDRKVGLQYTYDRGRKIYVRG